MNEKKKLTEGGICNNLIRFSIPYVVACFLQNFYGLVDLIIVGKFNDASTIAAVAVGSQVMHMVTVLIVGFSVGTTVLVSRSVGAGDNRTIRKAIGNSVVLFGGVIVALTVVLIWRISDIMRVLSVPKESIVETKRYLFVTFVGILFITAYNVICGIFRGLGDSKTPMIFVGIAGVINVGLDYAFVGMGNLGCIGAAIATVIAQGCSVVMALVYVKVTFRELCLQRQDFRLQRNICRNIIEVGVPIALQDGLIQIAFMIITVIANRKGVEVAAAVGIVEKLISFMFLVPSAMLSAVSTITSACIGAKLPDRGRKTLRYGVTICIVTGCLFAIVCNLWASNIMRVFSTEEVVVRLGAQYLKAYVLDCIAAGVHFCFSGYFTAYCKAYISFVHNMVSVVSVRVPGSYMAASRFSNNLFPMGLAAPLGSLLSDMICVIVYVYLKKRGVFSNEKGVLL